MEYHIGMLSNDLQHKLDKGHRRAIVVPMNGNALMVYCFDKHERLIARWLKMQGLILGTRTCYSSPIMELKFLVPDAAFEAMRKRYRTFWIDVTTPAGGSEA